MRKAWDELKTPGPYAAELADITMEALARGSKKDILMININHRAHSPIYVIRAEEYDGVRGTTPLTLRVS